MYIFAMKSQFFIIFLLFSGAQNFKYALHFITMLIYFYTLLHAYFRHIVLKELYGNFKNFPQGKAMTVTSVLSSDFRCLSAWGIISSLVLSISCQVMHVRDFQT